MRAAILHRLLQSRSGSAAIIFGLSLPILAAAAGIAIDYSGWTRTKAQLQVIADRAALVGAQALSDGALQSQSLREAAAISAATATITGGRPGLESRVLIVDDGTSVQVDVDEPGTGYFLGIIGASAPQIGATATAEVASELPVCVIALAATGNHTLSIQGNAGLDASPCIVWVNSSAPQALRVGANAHLRALRNCVVGGWSTGSTILAQPEQCRVFDDPLAGKFEAPSSTGCNYNNLSVSGTQPITLNPGTYCGGLSISASNVKFEPGIYIIKDGPMKITSSGDITGNRVGIYLTGAKSTLALTSTARIHLTAPTRNETMEGLVIAGDASGPIRSATVRGGVALDLEGTIYLPGHSADLAGGADTTLPAEFSQFIAHTLSFTGNTTTAIRTNYNKSAVPRIAFNTSTIRLKR